MRRIENTALRQFGGGMTSGELLRCQMYARKTADTGCFDEFHTGPERTGWMVPI